MTLDRAIGLVGIILGVPAVVALYFDKPHTREAILTLVMVFIVVAFRTVQTYQDKLPPFTVLEVRKEFKIFDVGGTSARFESTRRLRTNMRGIKEFWQRSLTQDGTISNLLFDGNPPDLVESNAGMMSACVRFGRELTKGEEILIRFSYDLANAFPNPKKEGVFHLESFKTKYLFLSVDLPKPCTRAEFVKTYGGEQQELLDPPTISPDHKRIQVEVKKTVLGATYHLDWYW
jgi:hypothetical protein